MGILDTIGFTRLKDGLAKTRESLVTRVSRLVTARGRVDDEFLEELEEILIGADMGLDTSMEIIAALRLRAKKDRYEHTEELMALLKDEIRKHLLDVPGQTTLGQVPEGAGPYVVMVVGINGVGKTTTIGKLAHTFVSAGKNVVIGAADTFRAAANEQLEIWADRSGARIVRQQQGSDPAAVAFDAVRSAVAQGADVVIIDTAGRLHTKVNLMEELRKIRRAIAKVLPGAPHDVFLVLDASTGQNGLQQARQFGAAVGVTGLVLSKLDGTAKGGVVFAIAKDLKVPVRFIGVGEAIEDLQPFDAGVFVDALFARTEGGL